VWDIAWDMWEHQNAAMASSSQVSQLDAVMNLMKVDLPLDFCIDLQGAGKCMG
jgi:hypothetical protein